MPRAGTMAQISRTAASGGGSPSAGPAAGAGDVVRIERPSTRFRTFRQRNDFFQIQYPDNWRAAEPSSGYGVTLLPPGGAVRASNGQEVLVYGVVVNHYEPFEGSIGGIFSNRRGPVSWCGRAVSGPAPTIVNATVLSGERVSSRRRRSWSTSDSRTPGRQRAIACGMVSSTVLAARIAHLVRDRGQRATR